MLPDPIGDGRLRRCRGTNAHDEPCEALPMEGEDYCFFHHPDRAEEREAARREGGRHGRLKVLKEAPELRLDRVEDVTRLLADTINHVRTGRLDPRIGNTVGYLSGILLKALEQGEVEARLRALEQTIHHRGPLPETFSHEQT